MTPKLFTERVLNGAAVGIVVGLIPNAITGKLFEFLIATFPTITLFKTLLYVVAGIQFTVPVIIGILVAMQFKMNPVQTVIVATATFVGSGAAKFTEEGWKLVGIGDLINTMLTAAVAVLVIAWLGNKLGSLTVLFAPIIGGGISGLVGVLTLPYVMLITKAIGDLVNAIAKSTSLGIFASILIAMIFSVLIVSPISTVAISLAIGITGPASGAANLGVAAAASVLMIGSFRRNDAGVTWSVFLGAMKMMMGNIIKHPIMVLPLTLTAGVTAIVGRIFGIEGTPKSGGFGHVGMVGPIAASQYLNYGTLGNLLVLGLVYFVVPIGTGIALHILFTKVLKVYSPSIFDFSTVANETDAKSDTSATKVEEDAAKASAVGK